MKKDITYHDLIRIVHDKVPPYISFLLMLKIDFTNNTLYYILSFFLRFSSIIILCCNFTLSIQEAKETKTLSAYLNYITPFSLIETFKMTNILYIIISLIILVLFCLRISIYFFTIYKIKKKQNLDKLRLSKYQVLMDHLVFLFYPYLLEFLILIVYIHIFPQNPLFILDQNKFVNIIILIFNLLLAIGYNINNYFYLRLINRPYSDRDVAIKYRYSNKKFWLIFFMQNSALIQNFEKFLYTDKQFSIYTYCYFCVYALIFVALFFSSMDAFNYSVLTNHFVSIMTGFCFFSILVEGVVRILGYKIKSDLTFITFNLLKIVIATYFEYLNNNINNNKLFNLAKVELFKVNKHGISNINIYDVYLYILNILKNVKNNTQDIYSVNLLNTIFEHQNKCTLNNCKCKLLEILPHGEQYNSNYTLNLVERIGFLIESTFVQLDFSENYDLTLILSEHFYLLKENPIMAYSIIQTLLLFNFDNLSLEQYLILYETCQKYIESCMDSNNLGKRMLAKNKNPHLISKLQDKISHDVLKEKKFKNIFLIYEKIIAIQTMMNDYCQIVIDIMKKKNLVEESVKIKKNEDTGEITWIDFIFLDIKNTEEIIKHLKNETILNSKIFDEIADLKTAKLPMEFYYKLFIFCETFWEGKIDEKILPTFYSFTNDHNLFSNTINPNIFILLRQRYIDLNNQGLSQYYCIFKYTKGMTISYFSEPLSQCLGFIQSDLIDNSIDILMPNEISRPHNNLVMHYLITQQNRVYKTINNRMFNKKGLSIDTSMNGATLPGLGKNLLIILNIKLKENSKDYFLYYTQNLELISISNNFNKYFGLDINLINKCNFNLLTVFGINTDLIKKKLSAVMSILNEYKYNLDIMTEEIYAKKLFKQINKFNNIRYKLLEDIESHNLEENDNIFESKLLKAQKSLETIYNNKFIDEVKAPVLQFKKSKASVLNNFNRYINNNDKVDFNDKSYKTLIESFLMFHNFNQQNKNPNSSNSLNSIYTYSITVDILYDTPFISFQINEEEDSSMINQNIDNNFINKKLATTNMGLNDNLKNVSYGPSIKGEQNTRTYTDQTRNKTATNTSGVVKILTFHNKNRSKIKFFEKYIKEIIIAFIVCVLIVYVVILVYQLNVVNLCYNIFLAFYYNYIQRDKLVNLHSAISSGYYYYAALVDYTEYIPLQDYKEYIVDKAQKYSSAFHTFYQNYIKYRFSLGRDLSSLYENYNISKVSVNWNENNITSNYMNEVESIVHISTISSINDRLEDLKLTVDKFFNSNFKTLTGESRKVKTQFASILYYFSANMQNSFLSFFRKIQNEINEAEQNYSQSSILICSLVEILGFVVCLVTLSSCMFFLIRANRTIFRNISNLFVDFTQQDEYSFKNSYDNYIIVEKLTELKFLINNFSIKAIDKFNKKISYTSIDLNDERGDGSLLSIESKPSFNKGKKNYEKEHDKKKVKIKNHHSIENANTTNNNITNGSLLNSKTQNKLINTNSVNIISKLNQNINNNIDKSNSNVNTTASKLSLINDSSIKNISTAGNKKKEDDEDMLTADKVSEKIKIVDINSIKILLWILLIIMIILLIYVFCKILVTMNNLKNIKQMFVDYSIVTFEYSMIINYFNNLNLILVNQQMGREDVLNRMQVEVEAQFKQSEEVKKKSISNYPNVYKIFSDLNNEKDQINLKTVLCGNDKYCSKIFDSKFNIVKNGIDVGLKTVAQVIYNVYKDFLQLKNQIDDVEKIKEHFINDDYRQVDMSLNFLLNLVEDRCAAAFLIDCNKLINKFRALLITLNIFIIVFLVANSIFLTFFIIDRIVHLSNLIEKSSLRLSTTICFIKEKNIGFKVKTTSIL